MLCQYDNINFADLPASHVAALHEPTRARTLSARYLRPLDALKVRIPHRVVDTRFPDGAALIRLDNDRAVRYVQNLEQLPVVEADSDQIVFLTPYPAGPFVHHTPRSVWEHDIGDVTIPERDGDGSRIISADHTALDESKQHELPSDAHRNHLVDCAVQLKFKQAAGSSSDTTMRRRCFQESLTLAVQRASTVPRPEIPELERCVAPARPCVPPSAPLRTERLRLRNRGQDGL